MHLSESILLDHPPHIIWPLVADPLLQSRWNPKLISLDREASGPVQAGEQYNELVKITRRSPDKLVHTHVLVSEPPHLLVLEHILDKPAPIQVTHVSIELKPVGQGTQVTLSTRMDLAGVPWWVRWLIRTIMTLGSRSEPGLLQHLRREVDHSIHSQA